MVVRGGRDTTDKLRVHATRTVRAWSLDGNPLYGISVFAVLGVSLDELLVQRFATFRSVYLPAVARLREHGFELLPTGQSPHFTVRLTGADDLELTRLLMALGDPQRNSQYARTQI